MGKKILALFVTALLGMQVSAVAQREVRNLDFDWYFHKGDVENGFADGVDFSGWRKLDVPHDFSIEGPYGKDWPGGGRMGFLPGGIGWYKKVLDWDPSWEGKRLYLEFDGVFMNSTVWVNGVEAGSRPNGYLTFGYDITPYMKSGRNIVSVRVDNSKQPAARWYTGSGIYRPVNLIVTEPIFVPQSGTYVTTPQADEKAATVRAEVEIRNMSAETAGVTVVSAVKDAAGREVARRSQRAELKPGEKYAYGGACCSGTEVVEPRYAGGLLPLHDD